MNSLVSLPANDYAKRTVEDASKLSGYHSSEWTERGLTVTLLIMYYSELGHATLRTQMVSPGKTVSAFFIGNFKDVEKATLSWVSFWDMTLPKS